MSMNIIWLLFLFSLATFFQTSLPRPYLVFDQEGAGSYDDDEDDDYGDILDQIIQEILALQPDPSSLVTTRTTTQSLLPTTPDAFSEWAKCKHDKIDAFDNQRDDGVSPIWLPFYVMAPKMSMATTTLPPPLPPPPELPIDLRRPSMSQILADVPIRRKLPPPPHSPARLRRITTTPEMEYQDEYYDDNDNEADIDQDYYTFERYEDELFYRDDGETTTTTDNNNNNNNKLRTLHRHTITSSDNLRCKINIADVSKCVLETAASCQASKWSVDVTVAAVASANDQKTGGPVLYLPTFISSVTVSSAAPVTNTDDRNYWNKFIKKTSVIADAQSASSPLEVKMRIETSCCLRQLKLDWLEASSYGQRAHQEPRSCELDLCNGNFCLNRGVCTPSNTCFCAQGWSGKHCERNSHFS